MRSLIARMSWPGRKSGGGSLAWTYDAKKKAPTSGPPPATAYTIVAVHSGKCLEIANSLQQDEAPAQQWTCYNDPNKHWFINPV
jgi:hypothetical protein